MKTSSIDKKSISFYNINIKKQNSKNKEDCFAGLDLNGVASLMVSDEKAM